MVFIEETYNLLPAAPETVTSFAKLAEDFLLPAYSRLSAKLVAAWASSVEWFRQVTHITEFDSLDSLKEFRISSCHDSGWAEYLAQLENFAPERHSRLLEPLGPVPSEKIHDYIAENRDRPRDEYFLAILQITSGKMDEFKEKLARRHNELPIIAAWTPYGQTTPNEVIDLWAHSISWQYKASDDSDKAFFRPLREIAPKERIKPIFMLPYSPLL